MSTLADHLRLHKEAIKDEWARRVKQRIPAASDKTGPALIDDLPDLIVHFASSLDQGDPEHRPALEYARKHALHRYQQDYDLRDVAAEYAILRDVMGEFVSRIPEVPGRPQSIMGAVRLMNHEMDAIVSEAIDFFIKERDRSRQLFIGMLSHDLRNPLDASRLALSMAARRSTLIETDRELVEAARSNLATMSRLVEDLADIMRVRLGKGIPVAREPIDVAALVREVTHGFGVAHANRDLEVAEMADLWAEADHVRITQVVTNLLWNAVKHGSDPIRVRAHAEGESVVVEVRNRGTISEAVRKGLFDPFTGGRGAGLGLGLYVVREILEAHEGRIEVASEHGETWFRAILPRA